MDANIQTRKSKKVSLLWWNYQKQIESTPRKKNHASRIKTNTNTTQLKEWGFQNQHHQNPQKPAKTGVVFGTVHESMPRAAEVMILREDSYWFQDFQLQKLLQTGEGRWTHEITGKVVGAPSNGGPPSFLTPPRSPLKGDISNKYTPKTHHFPYDELLGWCLCVRGFSTTEIEMWLVVFPKMELQEPKKDLQNVGSPPLSIDGSEIRQENRLGSLKHFVNNGINYLS